MQTSDPDEESDSGDAQQAVTEIASIGATRPVLGL
jgi:hypothetical protein